MTEDVPVTEIFEEVEADPDAIIASYGADSVEDLLEGDGEHDPRPDPKLDGDVEGAADRLSELADVQLESTPAADRSAADGGTGGRSADAESARERRYTGDDAGGVTVDVVPGDGETIESILGLDDFEEAETTGDHGLVLVGPEPSATRVSDETFGPVSGPECTVREPSTPNPSRTMSDWPDPTTIDSDGLTDREVELASSVFEWVS